MSDQVTGPKGKSILLKEHTQSINQTFGVKCNVHRLVQPSKLT